jgi:ADP-heptose:LPS heptosyltransferase
MNLVDKSIEILTDAYNRNNEPILIKSTRNMGDCLHVSIAVSHYKKLNPKRNVVWAISEKYVDTFKYFKHPSEIVGLPHDLTLENRQKVTRHMKHLGIISPCVGVSGENYGGSIADQFLVNAKIQSLSVPRKPILPIGVEDIDWAKQFITKRALAKFICLEYNSFSIGRNLVGGIWPIEYYEEFLQKIDIPVVWIGHDGAPKFKHGIDARGISWRQAAALIKLSNLFIGSGSGLTMVAASRDVDQKIIEVGIGRHISMIGCGYSNSICINKPTPDTVIATIKKNI